MRYRIAPAHEDNRHRRFVAFNETYFLQANAECSHQMGRVRERRAATSAKSHFLIVAQKKKDRLAAVSSKSDQVF